MDEFEKIDYDKELKMFEKIEKFVIDQCDGDDNLSNRINDIVCISLDILQSELGLLNITDINKIRTLVEIVTIVSLLFIIINKEVENDVSDHDIISLLDNVEYYDSQVIMDIIKMLQNNNYNDEFKLVLSIISDANIISKYTPLDDDKIKTPSGKIILAQISSKCK